MPTNYPGGIDSFVNPTETDTLDDPPHHSLHTDKADAMIAVQTELGINPSGSFADVRARLDAVGSDMIASEVLSAAAASVVFDNIPQDFRSLLLVGLARSDDASGARFLKVRFNDDAANNYQVQQLQASGGTVTGSRSSLGSDLTVARITADTETADYFGHFFVWLPGYRSSRRKAALGESVANESPVIELRHGRWSGTAAITKLEVFADIGNLIADTELTLHGLRGAA